MYQNRKLVATALALALAPSAAGQDVYGWGRNLDGEIGDGGFSDQSLPVAVSVPSGEVVAVACGTFHSLALLSDGTMLAWGRNTEGQLGDGSNNPSEVPVAVTGLSGVTAIAAGAEFSLALLDDNTVRAWGANGDGQLGNGTNFASNVPVAVTGLSDATAIAAGDRHALAVRANGTIATWGDNTAGQLGNGTDFDANVPVAVTGIASALEVAGGSLHSLARVVGNTVLAWGANGDGQLGDGTTDPSSTPVSVSGLVDALEIAAGSEHSLARRSGGALSAWGSNSSGQLGINDDATAFSSTPVAVVGLSDVVAIDGGIDASYAVGSDGIVRGWGSGDNGRLGNGLDVERFAPTAVPTLTGAAAIDGSQHALCLVASTGCPADIAPDGGDGVVNVTDLLFMLGSWGACP
jgi:alpha-tubulin suppressor-like RCC1 family protein